MYSSTTLEGPSKSGCWKQLDYAEQNADSLFSLMYKSNLGIAAHAVMQYCVERNTETEADIRKTAEEVGNLLISKGRTFRGIEQPPLPADDVWQGVDVAVSYLLAKGLPTHPTAFNVAVERDYEHPELPYRALIDLRQQYDDGDEESAYGVDEVVDFKTSWQANESELNTLQRWGQAVIAWRTPSENAQVIRQRVINLRTWQDYTRDLWLDNPNDVAELEKWEKRIAALCEAADDMQDKIGTELGIIKKARPANPGVGCLNCQYRHICEDVWPLERAEQLHPEELARELAIIEGQRKLVIDMLKMMHLELPLQINGGYVGYKEQPRRVMMNGAEKHLLSDWFEAMAADIPEELAPVLSSLLASLKLGESNLDAFAKALYPERKKGIGEVRDEYVAGVTDEVRYGQFGVWKDD